MASENNYKRLIEKTNEQLADNEPLLKKMEADDVDYIDSLKISLMKYASILENQSNHMSASSADLIEKSSELDAPESIKKFV